MMRVPLAYAALACLSLAYLAAGCLAGPASAEISPAELARVGVHTRPGSRVALDLGFVDQAGRPTSLRRQLAGPPTLLVFADYRCTKLCGPALDIAAAAVSASGLRPGRDMHLAVIGLDPRQTPADAARMRAERLSSSGALLQDASLLTGDAQAIRTETAAVGFGYAYDPQSGQFTHPVAAFLLGATGQVMAVLPETALTGAQLRRAVQGADRGETGELADRLRLLCHELITPTGRYDAPVQTGLRLGAAATLLAMAAGLSALIARRRWPA